VSAHPLLAFVDATPQTAEQIATRAGSSVHAALAVLNAHWWEVHAGGVAGMPGMRYRQRILVKNTYRPGKSFAQECVW